MINFNEPIMVEKAFDYVREAINNKKLSGDGEFTKRCNFWLEKWSGAPKVLLTTSCTHATEMAAILADIKPGDEVYYAGLYVCLYGGCICFERCESKIC